MRVVAGVAGLALLALVATGCGGAKSSAQTAVTAAELAVSGAGPDVENVLPERLKALQAAAASAREAFDRKEYQAAAAAAKDIPARVKELADALPQERTALNEEWRTMSMVMPANLDSVRVRLDKLGKSKRLPAGMDATKVDAARQTYEAAMQEWPVITAAFNGGKLADALARASALRVRVSDAMTSVGMTADDKAWGNLQVRPVAPK